MGCVRLIQLMSNIYKRDKQKEITPPLHQARNVSVMVTAS